MGTNMTRYELAIATADFLEANPQRYDFQVGLVPENEFYQGCALGHMGRIAGIARGRVGCVAEQHLGITEMEFYAMMEKESYLWRYSAREAAKALRIVAKKGFAPAGFSIERAEYMKEYACSKNRMKIFA